MLDTKEQLKELSSALTFAADFKDYFRQILEFIKKMKIENKEEMTAVLTAMKNLSDRMIEDMADKMETGNYSDMEKKKKEMMAYCEKEMDKMMKDCKVKMAEMDKKMAEMKIMEMVMEKSEAPLMEKMKNDMPALGGQIASALEILPDGEKLKLDAIEGLKELLEELKNRPARLGGGGGFNLGSLNLHLFDDITPTGTVDGVNADFILPETPQPLSSLKVYVNGARLRITEDYTLSNKTISFLTAPPTGSIILCDFRA